jgi:hypothetical protein
MKHFEHFEADLDIPALAIDPDNLLVRQIHLGGQDRQPVSFVSMAHKHNPDPLPLVFRMTLVSIRASPGRFFSRPCTACPAYTIAPHACRRPGACFSAYSHRKVPGHCRNDRREREPTAHQDIVGIDRGSQYPFEHFLQLIGCFADCLRAPLVAQIRLSIGFSAS